MVEGIFGSSIVCDTMHKKLWDSGLPIHRGISKWRDMSEMVEVDTTDGSVISVVEPYWLWRFNWDLTSCIVMIFLSLLINVIARHSLKVKSIVLGPLSSVSCLLVRS